MMGCSLKTWFLVSTTLLSLLQAAIFVSGKPIQVPCLFVFGDSLVDPGNNNALPTTAKANYRPYGVDFPDGPTGRFTNGRNLADIIAQHLGFDQFVAPFATATDSEILNGVNYGSGGAGICDETGFQLGAVISLNKQLANHQITVARIAWLLGSKEAAANYLSKCIYSVGMGSNDYINNYLMPQYYPTSRMYTPDGFAAVLIDQYSEQLKTLYKYGAKKFAVFALGQIGCTPQEEAVYGTNGAACVDFINNDVQIFNDKLKQLVDDLNNNLTDAKFIYIGGTSGSTGIPSVPGSIVENSPCCTVSTTLGKGQCAPNTDPCRNRNMYAFYDGFHPTEVAYELLGLAAYVELAPLILLPS